MSSAIVVHVEDFGRNLLNFSNIERAGDVVANSDELSGNERFAVGFIIPLGVSFAFGFLGAIGEHVGDDAFVTSFGDIIGDRICRRTVSEG